MGTYGYGVPVSPRIDFLAAESVTFEDALAQSSWTKSSMASVFTGLWPWRHRAAGESDRLSAELRTLTQILHDSGYATGAFSANGYVSKTFGFDRGFDEFVHDDCARASSKVTLSAARESIRGETGTPYP